MKRNQPLSNSLCKLGLASILILAPSLSSPAGAQTASIQDTNVVVDPYPLRPPTTSSPRKTLHSFLTNANKIIEAWREDTEDAASDRAWLNAIQTLDFSKTPDSDTWSVQTEHLLLLKEVLDRVEIPTDNEIPGDEEVAEAGIDRWTIPNTRITITRSELGPGAGEFLFSAITVEALYRSYVNAKHLPYKPTASNPGFYETYTSSDRTHNALEKQLRTRLRRVNTSSPRSTLTAFLDYVNRANQLVMRAENALKAPPPTMTKSEARLIESAADNLLRRATATLDLSQIPRVHRRAAGIEAALKLKEILDRTLLPRLESIPDLTMMEAARQQESQLTLRPAGPFRWRYPNSEIEIVEIMEGDRQGEFLFSSSTVRQINDVYQSVRQLPYREEVIRAQESKFVWSDKSEDFYAYVFTNPGDLVPRLSFLGEFVESLPEWLKQGHGGNAPWQWIALGLCVLAVVLGVIAVLRVLKLLAGKLYSPLDSWLMVLAPILSMVIVMVVNHFVDESLNITGRLRTSVRNGSQTIVIIMMIWAVFRLCKTFAETVIASPRIQERSLDATLFRITMRLVAFLAGGWIVVISVRDLGADLVPLLAGLGVGGLAIALAAQRTFANFIGTLILSVNKPVKVGDFCRYGDQIGTVEQIGLLATRIRSLERTVVTVPNAEFSEMKLDNFALRDRRLLNTTLQLRYETTPEQMRYILAQLRELLLRHPKVTPDPARVRFVGYGAYSKDVQIFAYLDCQDQNTFLAMQEDVLLRIEDIIVNEAGSGFAFPSQTAYLSRDKGLDSERGKGVEAKVKRWRSSGKLPFPEFDGEHREQIQDTLDYPPKGSPGYVRPEATVDRPVAAGPSTLSEEDFVDLPSFAEKLQEPTQIANYLWGQLSGKTQKLLSHYTADTDKEVREALMEELNEIIKGPSIYAVDRFSEIKRRQETLVLLDAKTEGDELARLNRLLLEDAFPEELQHTKPA